MSSDSPVKKPRAFRMALLILLALLLLAAAGMYFLPHILPTDAIRSLARDKIRESTGLDVDFAAMRFGWSDGLTLEGVTASVPGAGGGDAVRLATFDTVRVLWAWTPLLSGTAVVDKFEIDGFSVRLVRDADGKFNLPVVQDPPAVALAPGSGAGRPMLAAVAPTGGEGGAQAQLPLGVEIRRIELRRGNLTFEDLGLAMEAEAGLESLDVEGGPLDGEFSFSGRLTPYPSTISAGAIPFSGKARLLKNLAFDRDGKAEVSLDIENIPLADVAGKFAMGDLFRGGAIRGGIAASYDAGAVRASLDGLRLEEVALGLGPDRTLILPDTRMSVNADVRPGDPKVVFTGLSLENALMEVSGQGWADGLVEPSGSGIPWGEFEFAGRTDVGGVAGYLEDGLGLTGLPDVAGSAGFAGRAALPRPDGADSAPRPTLSLSFQDGRVVAANLVEGVSGEIELAGTAIESTVALGDEQEISAALNLNALPVKALFAGLSDRPVVMNLTGVGAFHGKGDAAQAEFRLNSGGFDIPETPWAAPLKIETAETRMVFDLAGDRLDIDAANLTVNETIKAGIKSGVVEGILAGDPNGRFDAEFSALLETVEDSFRPLLPAGIAELGGAVRAAFRAVLSGGRAEMGANVELDKSKAALALSDARVGVETDLTTVGLSASADLADPRTIRMDALRIDNAGASVQFVDRSGASVAGRIGKSTFQANALFDLAGSRAEFGELRASSDGMSTEIGHGGARSATVTSGLIVLQANLTPEAPLTVPLGASGDFAVPELDFGVDNLVFLPVDASGREAANQFGRFAVKIGANGRLGAGTGADGQASEINLTRVEMLASPVAARAQGRFLPDSGALRMAYSAVIVPDRVKSLLDHLNIPSDLVEKAEISGSVDWDGVRLSTDGTARGGLRFNPDNVDPFVMNHNFDVSYSPADETLNVTMKSFDGSVTSASGDPIVTLSAHPSALTLSRSGVQGLLALRFDGSAGPTGALAAGLAGVVPQLHEFLPLLRQIRAEGVYNAWAQLQGRDAKNIVLKVGALWQGAALAMDGTQILSEPGRIGVSVEGAYGFDTGRLEMSKLSFGSDTAQIRAEGSAGATLPLAAGGDMSAVRDVVADLRFAVGDLSRTALTFPGIIPADLGLAGSVNGQLRASGDASAIRVEQGGMRFAGFRVQSGASDFQIPNGTASYDAVIALRFDRQTPADGSPFAPLRVIDVAGGRAGIQGAMFQGREITDFSTAFQLQNGALDIGTLQLALSGDPQGVVQLAGRVDFSRYDPAVDIALGVRQMPLSQLSAELGEFIVIESGVVNLPASTAATARISFTGLSEDAILQTIKLDNFNFATGPVVLHTGPKVNVELDKARVLLRQEAKGDSEDRVVTLETLTGSVLANGSGVLEIPASNPIRVVGDNTGDFAIRGRVMANHTLDLDAMLAGKLERVLGFSLPSVIPNLRHQTQEDQSRFMAALNRNAANGNYRIKVQGSFDSPQISGIPELAMAVLRDITLAAPGAVISGVLNAPQAILDAPGNIGRELGNILGVNNGGGSESGTPSVPQAILDAPGNLGRGLGNILGVNNGSGSESGTPSVPQAILDAPGNLGRGLGNILGINRDNSDSESGGGGSMSGILPFFQGRGNESGAAERPEAPVSGVEAAPTASGSALDAVLPHSVISAPPVETPGIQMVRPPSSGGAVVPDMGAASPIAASVPQAETPEMWTLLRPPEPSASPVESVEPPPAAAPPPLESPVEFGGVMLPIPMNDSAEDVPDGAVALPPPPALMEAIEGLPPL